MIKHSVEKIGGTSMTDYPAVRDNIILKPQSGFLYGRIFVVSAYGGITDKLLEHKKSGQPGVYASFANDRDTRDWRKLLDTLSYHLEAINQDLFLDATSLARANQFIKQRVEDVRECLENLQSLCDHGHFSLEEHLDTVREMLASLGEAHSAWNMATLLKNDGINARFIDLTGWRDSKQTTLDQRIKNAFETIDLDNELPVVTGYAHSETGLMKTFNRGYSEMTFSRIAVVTSAKEAIIHKEFHLSSADPKLVGTANAVPIGRTNYDVADQLANLGMEAIHPKAAKGLRQQKIPLRVKNTFEPEHNGTLITTDYVSDIPRVEIIAGSKGVYSIELFDQNMAGNIIEFDRQILSIIQRFNANIISKDINANTITHYLSANLKTIKRIITQLKQHFVGAEINQQRVALVSAIGSDMQVPGILAQAVNALSEKNISVLAIQQSIRQVDIRFILRESDYETAILALHNRLVEIHNHGPAICLAS